MPIQKRLDRFFRHNRRAAHYFLDPVLSFRFVVLDDDPVLVSVESVFSKK